MSALSRAVLLALALTVGLSACGVKGKLKSPEQIALEDKKKAAKEAKEAKDKQDADAEAKAKAAQADPTTDEHLVVAPVGTPGALDQSAK